jgi:hypothetical protein
MYLLKLFSQSLYGWHLAWQSPTLGADTRVQLTAAAFTLDGWVEGASEANPTDSLKKKRSKPSDTGKHQNVILQPSRTDVLIFNEVTVQICTVRKYG